ATIVVANQVLNRWQPVAIAAGAHATSWREQFLTQLSEMPVLWLRMFDALHPNAALDAKSDYARFEQMFVNARANIARTAKVATKLASATSDLVFVPIVPCRVVDTRNTGSPVAAGTTATFYFYADSNAFTFSSQAGIPCAVA